MQQQYFSGKQQEVQTQSTYPYLSGTPDEPETIDGPAIERPYHNGYSYQVQPEVPVSTAPPAYTSTYTHAQQQQIQYVPVYTTPRGQQAQALDGKILAALSYVGFWMTGLLLFLFVRDNKFIRFHAL